MSCYDIKNALTKTYMPLSDNIHGPYCMMPPELLHTSGSGLIKYMFESLQWQTGSGKNCDDIDKLHIPVCMSIKRQSERDFPQGAMRNGIIDGTKRETCFSSYALPMQKREHEVARFIGTHFFKMEKIQEFIKLYLSME